MGSAAECVVLLQKKVATAVCASRARFLPVPPLAVAPAAAHAAQRLVPYTLAFSARGLLACPVAPGIVEGLAEVGSTSLHVGVHGIT